MKKILALILSALLVFSLTACGGSSPSTPASSGSTPAPSSSVAPDTSSAAAPSGNQEPRTVTWMTVRSAWSAMDQISEEYMALNPNITIEFDRISDRGSFNQKAQILAASNSLPDLLDAPAKQLKQEIGNSGALVDIEALYTELGYDRILPIGLEYGRLPDGKLYEMAWENNVEYFWYNKEMFAAAGIEKTPETFDEFLAVCQKLTDAGSVPISVFPGWHVSRFLSFIPFRLTGNQFSADVIAGRASMGDPVGIESAEFLQELGTKYFQPGWATSDYSNALSTFLGGHAAMYLIGSWQFGSFLDEAGEVKDEFGFFRLPTMPNAINGKTDMIAHAGTGTMINAAKFDDTLKSFVSYVLDEYPDKAFWDNNVLPAATFDTSRGQLSGFWQDVLDECNSLTSFIQFWDTQLGASSGEALSREQTNLGMGVITPEEFAKRMDEALAAER